MNPSGVVLAIAGVWVVVQVFGGKALQRLGIVPGDFGAGALPSTPGSSGDSGLGDGGQSGGGSGGGGGGSW